MNQPSPERQSLDLQVCGPVEGRIGEVCEVEVGRKVMSVVEAVEMVKV